MTITLTIHGRTRTASRAPKGGVTVNGRFYRGGQFMPTEKTELPTLKGTEKQVKWAEEIRAGMLTAIDAKLAELAADATEFGEDDHDRRAARHLKVARHLLTAVIKDASTIINERNVPATSLFFEAFSLRIDARFEQWAKAAGV